MHLVGIFANHSEFQIIKQNIMKMIKRKDLELINITSKNIQNMKNIVFETIILYSKQHINDIQKSILNKLCSHSRYIIMNADIFNKTQIISNRKINCITYGLNQKSTITISSIQEDKAIISIQRNMMNIKEKEVEMGEISIDLKENKQNNIEDLLTVYALYFVYDC